MKVFGKLALSGFCALTILSSLAAAPAPRVSNPSAGPDRAVASDSTRDRFERDLGFALDDLTYELARDLEIPASNGVVLLHVDPSSVAYRESELRGGMVIVEMADQVVTDRNDFERIYRSLPEDTYFLVIYYLPLDPAPRMTALVKPCASC